MRPDEAIVRLEAIAAVKSEMRPVVDVALQVVRAAQVEIEKAETRAELAEDLVSQVRPQMVELAKLATDAEEREAIVKRAMAINVKKAAVATEEQRRDAALETLAKSIETLKTSVEKLAEAPVVRDAVQVLQAIHSCTRDQNGKSAIQNRSPYAGSPWTVVDIDGAVIQVVECRKDAVQLVVKLLEEELAESRRRKQPGESHPYDEDDFVPGAGQGQSTRPDVANDPEWHASPFHPDDEEDDDDE